MDCDFSTLELAEHDENVRGPELVQHDVTARAPERDYDTAAFELDSSALAPQVIPDTTPQVFYHDSLPEAHDNNQTFTKERAFSIYAIKLTLKWRWIIVLLVIVCTIAIGVGVGFWRRHEHSSSTNSPTRNHDIILNDTSLTAVILTNGDRQLFFQENSGLIRRAIRTQSNSQWSTSPYLKASTNSFLNSSSNPKNHTPLAVATLRGDEDTGSEKIELYYVSQSHTLYAMLLNLGSWSLDTSLSTYNAAANTRSLSVTSIGNGSSSTNTTTNLALIYYENPNGNMSALLQRGDPLYQAQWVDITSQGSESLPAEFRNVPNSTTMDQSATLYESDTGATFNTPFISGAGFDALFDTPFTTSAGFLYTCAESPSCFAIGAIALETYSPPNATIDNSGSPDSAGNFVYTTYTIGLGGPGNFSSGQFKSSGNYASIYQSDIAIFGTYSLKYLIWINGTRPTIVVTPDFENQQEAATPDIVFPFARLASVTSADQSSTFLYHQINGTTLAEEEWDALSNAWVSSVYITVSGS